MTNGTSQTNGLQTAIVIESSFEAQHGVQLDQSQGGCRIIEINFAIFDLSNQGLWQRVHVDLEPDCKCCFRTNTWPNPAQLASLDRVVKFEFARPVRFVAKSVVAKRLSSLLDHPPRVLA